jgi:hypothetical protein
MTKDIDGVVEGALKLRKATVEKLFWFLEKSGKVSIFIIFATIVAIISFIVGSRIKEKEDDKILRHFHN